MSPHSIHKPSSTPHQVSEKAIKEVPAVVREQLGLKEAWSPSDLLPINPGPGEVLDTMKEVCGRGGGRVTE